MIDFVKVIVSILLPQDWINNPILRENGFALTTINEDTAEVLTGKTAEYKGLVFKIIPSTLGTGNYTMVVSGSLHRYHNSGESNHDRFSFVDCVNVVSELFEMFGINPETAFLQTLEFGVNLRLPYSPKRVIDAIVVHGIRPFEAMAGNRRKGVICEKSRYFIKIYDKGFVSGNYGKNILRVEYHANKMRELERFGIKKLSDLTDYSKVFHLLELLISAVESTVFIPSNTDLSNLTDREIRNFHALRLPSNWKEFSKSQRYKAKLSLDRILKKCNAFDYQTDLIKRISEEWKALFIVPNEAKKVATFAPLLIESEAHEKATFAPLECTVQRSPNPQNQELGNFEEKTPIIRTCKSCGKDISMNRIDSVFCSEKYNSHAKQCRNKDSNKRRTFKAQIMRAKESNQWLRVTYKNLENPNVLTYSEILHSSEITVARGWLNTIVSIEIFKDAPTLALYQDSHFEESETLTGVDARNYAGRLTRENQREHE
jgi:hypothetical protein